MPAAFSKTNDYIPQITAYPTDFAWPIHLPNVGAENSKKPKQSVWLPTYFASSYTWRTLLASHYPYICRMWFSIPGSQATTVTALSAHFSKNNSSVSAVKGFLWVTAASVGSNFSLNERFQSMWSETLEVSGFTQWTQTNFIL